MAPSKYFRVTQYKAGTYPKNQLDKVRILFSNAFGGRTLSEEGLRWQMEGNPCLKERATSLWEGDRLIAYNALTPFPAILCGKDIIAAVSGTTMADEDFPGTSVQMKTEIKKQNEDINVFFGFPNRNSFRISVKYLDAHYVGDVAFWMAAAKKMTISEKIHEFYEFTGEYEAISRELAKEHEFIKLRNKDFLNWRFFQKPGAEYHGYEYEKRGYIVADIYIENEAKQLQIVDILADSEEIMDALLKYAVNLAHEWDCSVAKLWLTSKRYEKLLEENGFLYGEHPFPMTVRDQDLDIAKSYITMGDSDIF